MKNTRPRLLKSMRFYITICLCVFCKTLFAQELYDVPEGVHTGWTSFENITGAKGKAAFENKGAKGHAFDNLKAGESKVLLDLQGAGVIKRIWMTMTDENPVMLRSLRLDMYWDGAKKPAVSVPLGDFFGVGLGRKAPFQSALFADPEGRSFNCYIPMPFKKGARIVITNESDKNLMLIFYDINFIKLDKQPKDINYFHAYWSRNNHTKLGESFEILPKVEGRGRFLGCNAGIITDTAKYGNSWWGEGEVRMFLDGDTDHPSLAGTGSEDYIGTGWGEGVYSHLYQGCTISDPKKHQWAFYRYHIPDPVYFHKDCKVVIEQIGGSGTDAVRQLVKAGAPLIPISVDISPEQKEKRLIRLLEMEKPTSILDEKNFPDGFTAFYRLDNYTATAYFYLNTPESNLPALAPLNERTEGLKVK